MEGEEVPKSTNGDQAAVSSLSQSQDTIEKLPQEPKSEDQTNDTEETSTAKSPVKQEDKAREEFEKKSPTQTGPSKNVREGQKWNDRPRKFHSDQKQRPQKWHNNKSDLLSQKESSDPVAIRKQVRTSSMLPIFI